MENPQPDQYRLCCGGLLEAELVNGRVLLNCLTCGTIWQRQNDGILGVSHHGHTYLGNTYMSTFSNSLTNRVNGNGRAVHPNES